MTSRLDRLVTLLESGTTPAVRQTAAKQLGDITKRFFSPDASSGEGRKVDEAHQVVSLETGWEDASALVARILPSLRSKAMETRVAAVDALSHIAQAVPLWNPDEAKSGSSVEQALSFSDPTLTFSVQQILQSENTLVASAGTEFRADNRKRTQEERLRAQKEMLGSVGIQNMDSAELIGDADMEVEGPVIKAENNDEEQKPPARKRLKVETKAGRASNAAKGVDPLEGLSGRQVLILKRKRRAGMGEDEIAEEAMRMRLGVGPSTTPGHERGQDDTLHQDTKEVTPVKNGAGFGDNTTSSGRAKGAANNGGTVASGSIQGFSLAEADSGSWIWKPYVDDLAGSLLDPAWEVRHGTALGLSAILRVHGGACGMQAGRTKAENTRLHDQACLALAYRALRTMVLDRFGDFVGDQVIAPVREATSQTLASLLEHMSETTLLAVHTALLDMIFQTSASGTATPYVWEVRHAGLLGLKYEVALRTDMFGVATSAPPADATAELAADSTARLEEVVAAASSGLGDRDDDVRAVSASCLTPIASVLVEKLSDVRLAALLDGLWRCFMVDGDDLGSSIASVMELLSKLLSLPRIIQFYADSANKDAALGDLIPRLYPFFRHTIMNVRLILVRTVKVFLENPSLPKSWVDSRIFHLLYENIILEERDSVRTGTAEAWSAALALTASRNDLLSSSILVNLGGWLNIAMTPIGDGLNRKIFLSVPPAGTGTVGGHEYDVDKHMLASDLSLVSEEVILHNRISAIRALAEIARYDSDAATHMTLLTGYMLSTSAHQLFLSAILAEEWALVRERFIAANSTEPLPVLVPASAPVADAFLRLLERGSIPEYYESKPQYELLRRESEGLRLMLEREASTKKRKHEISVDLSTMEGIEVLIGTCFSEATAKIPVAQRKNDASLLSDKKRIIETIIASHKRLKDALDNRVFSATAAAVVALRIVPAKLNPIIQNIMRSVKAETYEELQLRAASALAIFVSSCLDPNSSLPTGPPNKIVSNLANFLCQDDSYTPQVLQYPQHAGIMTLGVDVAEIAPKASDAAEISPSDKASYLVRRGAQFALQAIMHRLGSRALDALPRLWQVMTEALILRLDADDGPDMDQEHVQGVVDALTILRTVASQMDVSLLERVAKVLPFVTRASRSKWAVLRKAAADCLASLCEVIPEEGIKALLYRTVPLLSDFGNLYHRQGGIEALNLVIQKLDIKILPYVLFLIVPVLGRMSDPDPQVRALSTNSFATLVKMIPLEQGIPEPPGFSKEETAKRETEREFISQLLDNKRVATYELPVAIDAELRPYQRDGVSWLAFLAKYQLHGILCDDMGLGKSLQSICIMASKHEERRILFEQGRDEEYRPIPSIVVCPPTLIGHWHSEIPKFCNNLKPLRYLGNSAQREAIRRKFSTHNVIITSYETVRSDIGYLQKRNFLYCILDEGHAIKNGKSKLSIAIKNLQAVHRLVLSGTPIQNNVLELWNLFDFLMPGFLGTERTFHERFSRPILANREGKATPKQKEAATLALDALHKQVLPFLLRRLKTDVLDDLPPKIVQDYECELSPVQQRLYDDFAKSQSAKASEAALSSSEGGEGKQHIFQSLQYLRKLCNHPMLALDGNEGKLREVIRAAASSKDAEDVPKDILDLRHSPKLLALKQILNDCGIGLEGAESAEDMDTMSRHRVLVFCQSRGMLDIIERLLFARNMSSVSFMRLDGGTSPLARHDVAQKFNNDPSIDVLLLTTSIGGLGLTLTGADTVVFVDHDWNPMKDLQAMDRAHRIGQKKVVNVYRLITKGTLEEKIMGLQRFKINVANSVVNQQNSGLATMNTDQVLDLFTVSAEEESGGKGKGSGVGGGSVTDKAGGTVLAGLDDLPPEDEYSSLSLEAFIAKA